MIKQLAFIFLAFVVNTTLTVYLTTEGSSLNLLLKSMSVSLMIFFIVYYVKLNIELRKKESEEETQRETITRVTRKAHKKDSDALE
ncbi:hypothetical protein [Staphylococcus massiliensis]|uniref:Uncharacterized protein n=1 Tax=Staphylococcus massiliensis S46 TaxID=1229783 RepID=K9AFE2_9STAP|nr:hypothetical protein [Staphylococcus massiliensis]EKU45988.1 hypothetical protein C273_10327 [Staphylococcus massiliensis S46]MCG3399260.1 hypothetical protein [Staphylococcus massiliensis]MCG3402314.1 hypothetical protein [Staphylococcus massiliensis]MCG3411717.1 hypothetical protein [Staphylococcus massiliensis]POA01882.1 hypothetical protein CD133_00580 [Staphylococcus massiliensis CCUG 55927]